ncbi:rhodanese-related sulfurtransferase [Ereboglobus sp. PH5-5]|uniref:rhodanese-like domain-containing protein n=1 Tax=Ereboglobus sp. PH5-5 TaxID=2940529 RepID=UPI002406FDAD|nr:rhodanese-like domain-containing protein [Ereboglobus sp. PH5-5]MDF9833824.1 rhodanese-related sulfurtransferase [Ereboglobus sp. PH5-5]
MRPLLRQALILLVLAAVPALISGFMHRELFDDPPLAGDETTWAQVYAWQREAGAATSQPRILLIDARPSESHAASHAPGALPLNPAHWEQQLPAIIEELGRAAETRVVVYCDDALCDTSRTVAERIRRELALTNVFILKGGWRAR